jgi:hypothetical protein
VNAQHAVNLLPLTGINWKGGRFMRRGKATVEEIFRELNQTISWEPFYDDPFYEGILNAGFNRATLKPAFVLSQIVERLGPISVRGAMYRGVSAGIFPNTNAEYYRATCSILLKLRRRGIINYSQIVDATRTRTRPSSWTGLQEYWEVCRDAYRKDFWIEQPVCLEVFVEKLAMDGVLRPITEEFDVELNIFRGFSSETFVWSIAEAWNQIPKPIHVLYLGDHDPAGLRIEETIQKKLRDFAPKARFTWERLAVTHDDLKDKSLLGFPVKKLERPSKWKPYIKKYGDRCVEVDAFEPGVIRDRLRLAIESRIDRRRWEMQKAIEDEERKLAMQVFVPVQKVARKGALP